MKRNIFTQLWLSGRILFLFCLTSTWVNAQVNSYSYTESSGTYTPITGGTVIGTATDANPAGAPESAPMDDFTYSALLPFNFAFNGVTYDSVRLNTNGWVSFGTNTTSTSTPVSSTTTYNGVICAFGHDLMGIFSTTGITTSGSNVLTSVANTSRCKIGAPIQGAGIPAGSTITAFTANSITISANATVTVTAAVFMTFATGEIRIQSIGTTPNRTIVIQYSGFSKYATSAGTTNNITLDFQIRLSETSGNVSIVYNNFLGSATSYTSQVGLRGSGNADYNNRSSTTSWSTTAAGTSNSASLTWTTAIFPANGQTYTWTAPSCFAPSAVTISAIAAYGATASWTAPASAPASGYEYYVSTSSTAPTAATVPTGSTLAGITTTPVSTLSPNTLYYIWVRSACSPTNKSGWTVAVTFTTLVTCGPPTAVTVPVGTITTSVATINWTATAVGPPITYEWEVRTSGAAGSGATGLAANGTASAATANATGLLPATAYSVYVRTNCSAANGNSTWTSAVTFTTLCNTFALPFQQGFNTGAMPPCWSTSNASANTNANALWKFSGPPDYGAAPAINGRTNGTFAWVDGSDPSTIPDVTLTSPLINLTGLTAPAITFDYFSNNTNTYPNNIFKVDVNNGSGWVNIYSDNTSLATWRTLVVPLPAGYANSTVQLRFVVDKTPPAVGFAFYNDILLDSLSFIESPSCNVPTSIAVPAANITSTTAQVTWAAPAVGAAIGYQWEVRSSGAGGSGATGLAANGSTLALVVTASASALAANTTYTVYVRTQCGATTYSSWATGPTFTTLCAAVNAPYLENFEGTTFAPNCWSQATGILAAPTVFTTANNFWNQQNYGDASLAIGSSTNKSARINIYGTNRKDWLITPSINLGTTPKQLEFDMSYTLYFASGSAILGADDKIAVVISTDNGVTWTSANALQQWNSTTPIANGAGNHITISLAAYTGVVKLGFYGESTVSNEDNDLFIDNVGVNSLCPAVNLGADVSVCNNGPYSQVLNAGNAGATYLWNNGSTAQTRTVTASGTYFVDVTIGTCTKRDSIVITLKPIPVVALGNDTTICSGKSVTLNAGNAGATYLWSNSQATQTITASTAGTYYVAVTGANSCIGRDTLILTVNPTPVVSLGNDTSICSGNSVTLNAGNAGATFFWSNSQTTQSISASTAATYFVAVTGANTCIGRDTLVLTVNPLPIVNIGNDTAICTGDSLTLNAANAGATYLWDDASTSVTRNIGSAGAFFVTVTAANTCKRADTIHVSLNPQVVVNLGNDTSICASMPLTLDAANAGAGYLWDDASAAQTRDVSAAGNYYVAVTDVNGCKGSDTIGVNMVPPPSGTINIVTGTDGEFTFSITNLQNIVGNSWDFGDQNTSFASTVQHTYTANGDYVVTLKLFGLCGDSVTLTQTLKVENILSINDLVLGNEQLALFPNPAKTVLNVTNKSGVIMKQVIAYNILGQLVYTAKADNSNSHQIKISGWASGIYTLKIETDRGVVIRKFEVIQ